VVSRNRFLNRDRLVNRQFVIEFVSATLFDLLLALSPVALEVSPSKIDGNGEPSDWSAPIYMQNWFPGPMGEDRSAKSALRQTSEQFHILVDSVEEYAIYMLDPTGNVVTWNAGAQKIKQYTAEEIIGKNFACFYTAEDVAAEKLQRNLREAVRRGHIRDQGPRVRKDGSIFQAEIVLTPLRDSAGNIRGYSKVTRDITDQIRSREFEAEKIAAEKASKAKL
jgi:PAS domain S-box-containing protein